MFFEVHGGPPLLVRQCAYTNIMKLIASHVAWFCPAAEDPYRPSHP
jgi:hypothetical protein